MSAKEQYQEFLIWLRAKHKEIVADYRNEPDESRLRYLRLLLKIQAEIWTTEKLLRDLHA